MNSLSSAQIGLHPGECGAWVVDSETGETFGHVVASDVFEEVYVVPMDAILKDIGTQMTFGVAWLPPTDEVQEQRRIAIGESEASDPLGSDGDLQSEEGDGADEPGPYSTHSATPGAYLPPPEIHNNTGPQLPHSCYTPYSDYIHVSTPGSQVETIQQMQYTGYSDVPPWVIQHSTTAQTPDSCGTYEYPPPYLPYNPVRQFPDSGYSSKRSSPAGTPTKKQKR